MCSGFVTRTLAAATVAASLFAMLGGCSEYYFDRRDTVSLHSGEAMAANRVTQTIDPWSPASGNRDIAYNGEKAAVASERYRTGRVIPPANALTSSTYNQAAQQAQQAANSQANSAPNAGASNSNGPTK
jgi:hypothetical protein